MSDTKSCPYCNEEIDSLALKCKHCGKSLLEDDSGDMATNLYWDGLGGQQTRLSDTPISNESDPLEKIKSLFAGRYEILEEVGRGGMAIVYKAVQRNLNRQVALKVLPQQFVHDEEYILRFHREAREVAKMNHPNIVTIFDEGELDGYHYLAMEFLEGKDLGEILIAKETLNAREIENVIPPIAEALDYVHSKGLVHRDIKSSNIFVLNDGRAVLTDFGIAKTAGKTKLTQVGSIIGTPEYMSPEQADGLEVDGRGDIYSLAVVMYEALTGTAPFKADNPITLIRKIIDKIPENPRKLNSDIPKWLDEIIMKCLEKNPDDRIQNGSSLADSIREHKIIIGEKTVSDLSATVELSNDNKKTQKITADQLPTLEKKKTSPKDKNSKSTIVMAGVAGIIVVIFALVYGLGLFNSAPPVQQIDAPINGNQSGKLVTDSSSFAGIVDSSNISGDTNAIDSTQIKKDMEDEESKLAEQKELENRRREAARQKQLRINLLETKIAAAKLETTDCKRKLDHATRMRERNLISPGDFNAAKDKYDAALKNERELEQQLAKLK